MKFALVLSVGIVLLVLMTCKDNPPGPPTDRPPDTTNHEFTWQTFTLGDGGSSVLYDVAIINDTLAYAVSVFPLATLHTVQSFMNSHNNEHPPYSATYIVFMSRAKEIRSRK